MAKINIDLTGLSGLAPKFFGDANALQGYGFTGNPTRRALGAKGQMAGGCWNPFRIFGYMAPPTSITNSALNLYFKDATYRLNSEFCATLYDAVGTGTTSNLVWAASKDTLFSRYSSAGLYNGFDMYTQLSPLFGSTPKIQDLEIYQVNGVNKIFFSYQNTGGTYSDIGIISPDGIGASTTWFSTITSGGGTYLSPLANLVMVPSADNFLYILESDGIHSSNVHRIDGTALTGGTNGTVKQGILIFPAERYLSDAVDFGGQLWIVAQTNQNTSNTGSFNASSIDVYVWNKQITTASSMHSVPISGMQSVRRIYVTPDGKLRLIGVSTDRTVQIREYNNSTFDIIKELPIWAYPPYRDSCAYFGGLFTWVGNDGKVYGHGKLPAASEADSSASDQLFILGDMSPRFNGLDASIGALIVYGNGSVGSASNPPTSQPGIILSYACNSTYNAIQWFPSGVGTLVGNDMLGEIQNVVQFADAGNVYTLNARLPGLSSVNYIRLWNLPNGSGGTTQMGTLSIYKNQSSTQIRNGQVSITQDDVARGYRYIPIGDQGNNTFALQFEVSWATNVALGDSTDWLPYMIEIDYDETTNLK